MATMIPGDIEEFGTEGEKAFYKFLEGVAKPVRFVVLLSLLGCRVHWVIESVTSIKTKMRRHGDGEKPPGRMMKGHKKKIANRDEPMMG